MKQVDLLSSPLFSSPPLLTVHGETDAHAAVAKQMIARVGEEQTRLHFVLSSSASLGTQLNWWSIESTVKLNIHHRTHTQTHTLARAQSCTLPTQVLIETRRTGISGSPHHCIKWRSSSFFPLALFSALLIFLLLLGLVVCPILICISKLCKRSHSP